MSVLGSVGKGKVQNTEPVAAHATKTRKILGKPKKQAGAPKGQENFLRRKTKILANVYKLKADDPTRKKLEEQIAAIEQSAQQDGKANFKHAYEALEEIKKQARRASKDLPPVSAADVERRIDHLSRMGGVRVIQANDTLGKVEALCVELRKAENQASTKPTLQRATGFLIDFESAEDKFRTDLLAAANIKNSLIKDIDQFPLDEKTQVIRNELALLQELSPAEAGPLPAFLNNALTAFHFNGVPVTGKAVTHAFELKVTEFETLIKACKDISKFQNTAKEPVPDEFKAIARRDRKRLALAKRQMKSEKESDRLVLKETKDDPRQVDVPYQWTDQRPEFGDFVDELPDDFLVDVSPDLTKACGAAGKKLIKDLLENNPDDVDLVFDLSIQTRGGLQELVGKGIGRQAPPTSPDLLQAKTGTTRLPAGKIQDYLDAKERYQNDGNAVTYAKALKSLLGVCTKKLKDKNINDADQASVKNAYEKLKAAIDAELPELNKVAEFVASVADEMLAAVNEHSPNNASQETTALDITLSDGSKQKLDMPSSINFKVGASMVKYELKDFLGAGALGAACRYEDDKGNSVVVKANLDPAEEKTEEFAQEIKMHNHLMKGPEADKKHVLKMEGAARGPDGKLYTLMENAGGGNMDRLGQNIRALGSAGVISQEALNAINQNLVRQAVKGLKYLQGRNMTHHDIKCDNYFLGEDGTVKLADFGSAQASDNAEGEVPNADEIQGAPALRAPEFKANAKASPTLTPKADTFTLGVMISMLTSPTEASEKADTFTSPKALTALDRLKNSMLDPDPTKRPTIEAVEYSTYLEDEVDPELVEKLLQASMAYSKKAGKEVASAQGEMNFLTGLMIKDKEKSAPDKDDKLTENLTKPGGAASQIRSELTTASEKRVQASDTIVRFNEATDEGVKSNCISFIRDNCSNAMMKSISNAEGYFRLANLNDNALQKEIADLKAMVLRTNTEYTKLIESQIAAKRKKIADINNRDDVKPLVDKVKEAQDALLRGPQDENQLTREQQEKAITKRIDRLTRLVKANTENDPTDAGWMEELDSADIAATLGEFDHANAILDQAEKALYKLIGLKGFETDLKGAIKQVANLEPAAKAKYGKILLEVNERIGKRDIDGAYEKYNQVASYLRNIEIKKDVSGNT